jgi:hypothetical protein
VHRATPTLADIWARLGRDSFGITAACAAKPARDSGPRLSTFGRIASGSRAHRGQSRRVTSALPPPRLNVLCLVIPMRSTPKPARDIRTRPPPGATHRCSGPLDGRWLNASRRPDT